MVYRVDCSFAGETSALVDSSGASRLFPTIVDALAAAEPYRLDGYDIIVTDDSSGAIAARLIHAHRTQVAARVIGERVTEDFVTEYLLQPVTVKDGGVWVRASEIVPWDLETVSRKALFGGVV